MLLPRSARAPREQQRKRRDAMLHRNGSRPVPNPQWLILLSCLLLIACGSAATAVGQSAPDTFTIGVIGDQTFSRDIQASYVILQQGVAEMSRQNPNVVLHCGDLIESSGTPDQVRALWTQATGILDGLPVTWYMTAGDHDVNPPAFQQDSPDRS